LGRAPLVNTHAAHHAHAGAPVFVDIEAAASSKLDPTFQNENVYYVPRFFSAAIIRENPASFGLQSQPLSAH
jgi:hypothetical protein